MKSCSAAASMFMATSIEPVDAPHTNSATNSCQGESTRLRAHSASPKGTNITPTTRRGFTFTRTAPTTDMAATAPTGSPNNVRPKTPAERCKRSFIAGTRAAQVPDPAPIRKNTTVTARRWTLGERSKDSECRSGGGSFGPMRNPGLVSDTRDRQSRHEHMLGNTESEHEFPPRVS
jgi:hypothetical protein